MKKYLVKVTEMYEHTYLVNANSEEGAERICAECSDGCDVFKDYSDTEYEARVPDGEDLSLYDVVEKGE